MQTSHLSGRSLLAVILIALGCHGSSASKTTSTTPSAKASGDAECTALEEVREAGSFVTVKQYTRSHPIAERLCTVLKLAAGCELLADLYEEGLGVERDEEKALDYLKMACKLGSGRSCARAGKLVADKNEDEAIELYATGCAYNNPRSCKRAQLREPEEALATDDYQMSDWLKRNASCPAAETALAAKERSAANASKTEPEASPPTVKPADPVVSNPTTGPTEKSKRPTADVYAAAETLKTDNEARGHWFDRDGGWMYGHDRKSKVQVRPLRNIPFTFHALAASNVDGLSTISLLCDDNADGTFAPSERIDATFRPGPLGLPAASVEHKTKGECTWEVPASAPNVDIRGFVFVEKTAYPLDGVTGVFKGINAKVFGVGRHGQKIKIDLPASAKAQTLVFVAAFGEADSLRTSEDPALALECSEFTFLSLKKDSVHYLKTVPGRETHCSLSIGLVDSITSKQASRSNISWFGWALKE